MKGGAIIKLIEVRPFKHNLFAKKHTRYSTCHTVASHPVYVHISLSQGILFCYTTLHNFVEFLKKNKRLILSCQLYVTLLLFKYYSVLSAGAGLLMIISSYCIYLLGCLRWVEDLNAASTNYLNQRIIKNRYTGHQEYIVHLNLRQIILAVFKAAPICYYLGASTDAYIH